jgi:hypothetical protein
MDEIGRMLGGWMKLLFQPIEHEFLAAPRACFPDPTSVQVARRPSIIQLLFRILAILIKGI